MELVPFNVLGVSADPVNGTPIGPLSEKNGRRALRARAPALVAHDLLSGPAGVDIEENGDDLAGTLRKMRPDDFGKRPPHAPDGG
jgi:hypothetical protein